MNVVGEWGEDGPTASLIRVFCSSASLLKSSLAGMVYCIARPEDAIVSAGASSQLARGAQRLEGGVENGLRCDQGRAPVTEPDSK